MPGAIALRQPRTGRELAIVAPLPDDMTALAEAVACPPSVDVDMAKVEASEGGLPR